MAARDEQQQIGKFDPIGEARGQRMRFEMVDRHERLGGGERQRLAGGEPDDDAADQAGPGGGRDAVEIGEFHLRLGERPRDDRVDDLDMGARGDLRHHAAEGGMFGDLAQHLVRQDFAAAVRPAADHGRRRLVAGRLDSQNAHRSFPGGDLIRCDRHRRRQPISPRRDGL